MNGSPIVREISESEIRNYESDGIVCLRGLFSEDWVVSMRDAAEESMKNPGELHAELSDATVPIFTLMLVPLALGVFCGGLARAKRAQAS